MTIDRATQEEEIGDLIRAKSSTYSGLYVHGTHTTPGEILLLVEELGYRKLPKDKPSLLEQENCHQVDNPSDWNMGASAQRDADIRHYEGKL